MSRGGGGFISNTVNWLSQNTFGALPAEGTKARQSIDAVAGYYRKFLDALPYRRQDGRAARALPRGRAANAFAEWEAFKNGEVSINAANDESAAVGGGVKGPRSRPWVNPTCHTHHNEQQLNATCFTRVFFSFLKAVGLVEPSPTRRPMSDRPYIQNHHTHHVCVLYILLPVLQYTRYWYTQHRRS